jgi:hypothetical protein
MVVAKKIVSIGPRIFEADLHSSHSFTGLMLKASTIQLNNANLAYLKIKHIKWKFIPILIDRAQ